MSLKSLLLDPFTAGPPDTLGALQAKVPAAEADLEAARREAAEAFADAQTTPSDLTRKRAEKTRAALTAARDYHTDLIGSISEFRRRQVETDAAAAEEAERAAREKHEAEFLALRKRHKAGVGRVDALITELAAALRDVLNDGDAIVRLSGLSNEARIQFRDELAHATLALSTCVNHRLSFAPGFLVVGTLWANEPERLTWPFYWSRLHEGLPS